MIKIFSIVNAEMGILTRYMQFKLLTAYDNLGPKGYQDFEPDDK